ncbi:Multimodular transpeptidase-transglycosylase [hydrothermal vent metagenome]|uniref:peptidoglycan glycosyltransferase n=1 Tax=hydrothermal vent metagenome TaxID=652676 RepID=A0A1W1C0G8_9ZZZZ
MCHKSKDQTGVSIKISKFIVVSTIVTLLSSISFLIFDYFVPMDISATKDISRVVKSSDESWLYAQTNSSDKWRFGIDIEEIDPHYIDMLLAFEDRNFYSHYGVDILAMLRAISQLIANQRVVSGGSTITMQLARLLKPKPRTISSKLIEMVNALQLELHYSKKEILSAYLTLTPYGGNVEGLVAASMRYFGKLPDRLTASQSALLVALPQSPERNRPDRYLSDATKARDRVLKMAYDRGLINGYEYNLSISQRASSKIYRFPRYAPHLSSKILFENNISREISTTLDISIQKELEVWAKGKSYLLPKDTTMAMVVAENSNSSIVAYLGSHDRFSSSVSGFVDMVRSIRSPGSTLKPFIYALAFDKHLIHPYSIIIDKESRFGDYMPHNFSNRYSGEVTVAYALQHSLNIPAVKILHRVGVGDFVDRLEGVVGRVYIPKDRATLPIALGGLGLSLWQLTQLYVTLANYGVSSPLHYLPSIGGQKLLRFCDAKSAKMTTAILRELQPPDGFVNRNGRIAYKTGTSYGYRDNWTIAYSSDYTIAVWVGKPNNATQSQFTGRSMAAPLAFEAFSILDNLKPISDWSWRSSFLSHTPPKALRYFSKREYLEDRDRLKFVYPRADSRYRSAGCSKTLVDIKIDRGKRPYYWYIDNLPMDINRSYTTLPFDYGSHTITVIDSRGEKISRDIWIDRPEC